MVRIDSGYGLSEYVSRENIEEVSPVAGVYAVTPYAYPAPIPSVPDALVSHTYKTIEQNKPVEGSDSIEAILSGKKELLRSKIEMLLIHLDQRRGIHRQVLYGIDKDSCTAQSLLMGMEENAYSTLKERTQLEMTKLDLARQTRMEKVGYFKDSMLLNKDLEEALLQYMKELQNENLIMDGNIHQYN